ncbi:hypothetical protein QFZ66_002161 [Streptomyces sp. B4I13]|uniref:hypothetical protein n=1 Tax=Streptomyces sp. B4I13 TaxID=3042271 RepID=UPI00278274C0|nr:hypothetical protein [Streptomyces sp. B4I13]MDQ0958283.1 hypothetical protein [Streptomyces sp. B4I13]
MTPFRGTNCTGAITNGIAYRFQTNDDIQAIGQDAQWIVLGLNRVRFGFATN